MFWKSKSHRERWLGSTEGAQALRPASRQELLDPDGSMRQRVSRDPAFSSWSLQRSLLMRLTREMRRSRICRSAEEVLVDMPLALLVHSDNLS